MSIHFVFKMSGKTHGIQIYHMNCHLSSERGALSVIHTRTEEPAGSRTWERSYQKQEMNAADPEGGCTFHVNGLLLSGHPLHQSVSVQANKASFILL
jgi:hypothetical protein